MYSNFISAAVKSAVVAGICLSINLLLFRFTGLGAQYDNFVYSLPVLYLLYFAFTLIILFALYLIDKNNPSQIGYVFLGLTSLKVVGSYFVAQPIISKTIDFPTEKINFLAVFLIFLCVEVYFTAQLLNKKQ